MAKDIYMLSQKDYSAFLSSILVPPSLVATSPKQLKPNAGGVWHYDDHRDLSHNHFLLRTADPEKDRKADRFLWLGDALDFRRGWNGGVTPFHDALSLRITCVEVLKGNGTAKGVAAAQTVKIMRHLEWLIRWRNSLGVRSFHGLKPEHYRQFVQDASTSDITDLLPMVERLDVLLEDPSYLLPLYRHGRRFRMDWDAFADTLGVHRWSIGHSKKVKDAFAARLEMFLEKSSISIDDADIFHGGAEGRPSSERDPFDRLSAWDTLERLSIKGLLPHDALTFQPSQVDVTRDRPPAKSRTTSLLPSDLHRLLKLSAVWVLEFSPYILECLRERRHINPDGRRSMNVPSITALMKRMDAVKPVGVPLLSLALAPSSVLHNGRLLLSVALQYLFVAASILIGGFAGRRRNETGSLREDPIFRRRGITYLTVYIEKTIRDVDGVPVPELVEHAVALLETLSAEARKEDDSKWLFQFSTSLADGQNLGVDVNFGDNLISFVDFCGLEPPAGQAVWKLTYHMLRKGFVIASFHGNLWGSFDATNRSLRHWGGESSRHYMDDEEVGALAYLRREVARLTKASLKSLDPESEHYLQNAKKALQHHDTRRRIYNEGRQEFYVEMCMKVYDGTENPIGRGAALLLDTLNELTHHAYARIRVATIPTNGPADVRADVLNQVKAVAANSALYPVPGLPMYCNYRKPSDGVSSNANCHRAEAANRAPWRDDVPSKRPSSLSWPNYAFSSLSVCLGCECAVLFNQNQSEVATAIEARNQAIPFAATPALEEDARRYIDNIIRLVTEAKEAVDGKQLP